MHQFEQEHCSERVEHRIEEICSVELVCMHQFEQEHCSERVELQHCFEESCSVELFCT